MGIWESFRGLTTRSARATQQGAKSRRGRLKKHTRPRDLRVEQFEARVLLSINPVTEDDALWNRKLTEALDAAADLSRYSVDTLVQTDQWVVALAPGDSSDYRAAAAGAQSLGRAGALPDNFYIWQFSSYLNGIEAAQRLAASENVAMFYPLVPISVESAATPNDDLFRDQWNLRSIVQTGPAPSMNVTTAWDLTTLDGTPIRGNGVVIGIVDDGLESTHGDLSANVLNALGRDFNDNDFDPSPGAGNNHGTAVAGVAAARQNNSTGVSGVASGASLAGIRLTAAAPTDTLIAQALAHANGQIAIYNNSWVTTQDFQSLPSTLAALNNIGSGTAAAGRGGLGSVVVNAAGNSAYTGQRTDYQLLTSDRHVITVGAVGADGKPATYYDQASDTVRRYSEPGASLFVSAYSGSYVSMEWKGLVTTDRSLDNGYNTSGTDTDIFGQTLADANTTLGFNTNFTSTFGGTSAAAATVSGIIAMMLQTNPNLTYRDVQHILVQAARQNDFASEDWATNGGGHAVHHDYGFGVVDARKAVELASTWKAVRAESSQTTGVITLNRALPDNDLTGIVDTVTLQNQINKIEWAELTIDFGSGHADAGDLEIILTSPLGTEAVFSQPRADAAGPLGRWTFSTPRFWDEASGGDWTLTVRDRQTGQTGTLASWELRVRGVANVSGPDLSAVIPNAGSVIIPGSDIDPFRIAPRELLLRFNEGQQIDPASFAPDTIPAAQKSIQIINKATGQPVEFGYINIGDRANEVIVRFAESLPDGDYQLKIFGTGDNPLKNKATPIAEVFRLGEDLTLDFTLDLGPQVISVVPQPIARGTSGLTQARDKIEVYFDQELDAATATNRLFYQLIATQETATPDDDVIILPSVTPDGVVYDPVAKKVTLKFDDDLANLVTDPLKKGNGAFRLRIGNAYEKVTTTPITVGEAGENYYTAENLSASFGQASGPHSVILTADILASHATPYNLEWPGAVDEPGHRDLPANMGIEDHLDGDSDPDGVHGITNFTYSFPDIIGTDSSSGSPLFNLITAAQKQRAREIFSIYANYLGVTFTEVPSGGMRIATGDLKVFPRLTSAPGGVGGVAGGGLAVMDYAENWGASEFGGSWFQVALHEIGHLLGYGHSYDLPAYTVMGSSESGTTTVGSFEPVFPGDYDVVHGQHMYRPDSTDLDLYRFDLQERGLFSAEILAERLANSSLLDSSLTLYQQYVAQEKYTVNGTTVEIPVTRFRAIASNDDFYSEDSFLEMYLQPGTYFVGVSSTGNNQYDPAIDDTGIGGTTEGKYELRLNFRPGGVDPEDPATFLGSASNPSITDVTATLFDGDADGVPGGTYNFWFNVQAAAGAEADRDTIYVDKASTSTSPDGSLAAPFKTITAAFARAEQRVASGYGDQIVRIVGNNFANDDPSNPATLTDNLAYEIGRRAFDNTPLADGTQMEVPRGVTVMIDAGATFKLLGANINVGSLSQGIDKSRGALQVLGTPTQSVYFTSFHDETLGKDSEPNSTTAAKGDWGGLVFRNDIDHDYIAAYDPGMTTAAREVLETQGIFLNYVNHADIRYGGGEVIVNSVRGIYDPIHMAEARPTATYNTIRFSADAAMSGDPNSFADTRFQNWDPISPFTQEYDRVGPLVRGNRLFDNSVNGMYIRIRTDPGKPISEQEVAARWDDWDIVHVVPENLFLNGTPGGALRGARTTNLALVDEHHIQAVAGSSILDTETFTLFDGRHEVAFEFDRLPNANGVAAGRQQILIDPTDSAAVVASKIAVAINNVYNAGKLEISATAAGNIVTLTLDGAEIRLDGFGTYVARTDARLQVDPGMIVKLQGSRIETEIGAQLIAEGRGGTGDAPGYKVIFTSLLDDRYGAGGTFNTSDNTGTQQPSRGDWGGISFGPLSEGSIDQAVIAYGGGSTAIEGGFASFDPIEIRQAKVRVANSRFEYNDSGSAGDRNGRGFIGPATIYVRGAQPVIVNNDFLDNDGAILSIDVNALKSTVVPDWGRSTGAIGDFSAYGDNRGPLVRENRMSDTRKNGSTINAMEVRGGILTTESVWDDTDIVHVLTTQVIVRNYHHVGGLRLQSGVDESLVVKLQGANAGFVAEGTALEIDDRIGGTIQIVGMPGHPVVLTALADDSLGAGFDLFDRPQFDTNGNGIQIGAATPGAWAGITLDRYSNDRNVGVVNERELPYGSQADANSRPLQGAETLGELAPNEKAGDDNLRLGFEIRGSIRFDSPDDADVYVFKATPGSEIWLDIDRTTHALDAIIEVIDADGNVLARSDNSPAEVTSDDVYGDTSLLYEAFDSLRVKTMDRDRWFPSDRAATATDNRDFYTTNPRDPGMRLVLDGAPGGQARDYYIRVRSSLSMGVTGGEASIVEGSYFIVSFPDRNDVTRLVEFEFDKAGDGIGTSPVGNPRYGISIAAGDTADQVAVKIRDAVNSAAANEQLALSLSALPVTARILGAGTANVRVVLDGLHVGFNPRSTEANGTRALTHLTNTSGAYQLQLRLREMQEIPGSTVRYADIRYAQTGIEVLGFPGHSPLSGESSELSGDNNTMSGANPLGNLLGVDRNTISTAGYLDSRTDVDWYSITVDYQGIQSIPGFNDMGSIYATIFDIDYADGMARPDLKLWVYNSSGQLLLVGGASNVADDRSQPIPGAEVEDLSRGSVGARDPFIGTAYLPEGNNVTYYVAVTSTLAESTELDDTLSPLTRREPLNSINRIATEHFRPSGSMTARPYSNPNYSDPTFLGQRLTPIPNEFKLTDVVFYVNTTNDLYSVDPFTGALETDVSGTSARLPNDTGTNYNDIAMRNDGRLYTVTGRGTAGARQYMRLNTGNARQAVSTNTIGINTRFVDGNGALQTFTASGSIDIEFNALVHAFNSGGTSDRVALGVGHASSGVAAGEDATGAAHTYYRNLVYALNEDGSPIQYPSSPAPSTPRATSDIIPFGQLVPDAIEGGETGGASFTGLAYVDGQLYGVTDRGGIYRIDGVSSGTNVRSTGTWGFRPQDYDNQYDRIRATGGGPQATLISQVKYNGTNVSFSGLTTGPANVEGGKYSNVLFATDSNSVYAIDMSDPTAPQLVPVFEGSAYRAQLSVSGVRGLAFSPVDYNLWHMTRRRENDAGHGVENAYDQTRNGESDFRVPGDYSMYFGLEDPDTGLVAPGWAQPGATNFDNDSDAGDTEVFQSYNLPGGAYGSLSTNPFSLAGYSALDKPVLYFTYFAATEGSQHYDGAKVYISNDGAKWDLISTNTNTQDGGGRDSGVGRLMQTPTVATQIIDEIVDDGQWRQARVDLSRYAGMDNLRLRFDFSTAADMQIGDTSIGTADQRRYLAALPAWKLQDGDQFTIGSETFEIDLGYALVLPNVAGRAIGDGEWFEITDSLGTTVRFEFDKDGSVVQSPSLRAVNILDTSSTAAVGTAIRSAISASALRIAPYTDTTNDPNRIFLTRAMAVSQGAPVGDTADVVIQGNAPGTSGGTRVPLNGDMTINQVAQIITAVVNQQLNRTVDGVPITSAPEPLRAPSLTGINGRQFSIGAVTSDGLYQVTTFTYGGTGAGRINLAGVTTRADLALATANAINSTAAALGLNLSATSNGDVTMVGGTVAVFDPLTSGMTRAAQPILQLDTAVGDVMYLIGYTATSGKLPYSGTANEDSLGELQGDRPINQRYNDGDGPDDRFRRFNRGQNNYFEGFYIDDIIIGFAERGEMVTNATQNSNLTDFTFAPAPNLAIGEPAIVTTGSYQLEVRRGTDYGSYGNIFPATAINATFDTNYRFANDLSMTVPPAASIAHGQSFEIYDGLNRQTFIFLDSTIQGGGGGIQGMPIYFSAGQTGGQVARLVAAAINQAYQNGTLKVMAGTLSQDLQTSDQVDLWGAVRVTGLSSSYFGSLVDDGTLDGGDRNLVRDKGQIIIEANQILYSQQYGINVAPADRDTTAQWAHPGSGRTINAPNQLVPGIILENNLVAYSGTGGIRFEGETGQPTGAIPFGRIVNNTIYGPKTSQGGTGISVANSASPTILNNIVANLSVGITVDASSVTAGTVLGGTIYQGNATNVSGIASDVGTGLTGRVIPVGGPLFVDVANDNFYLKSGSQAIDSSVDRLEERQGFYDQILEPMGIPVSPIISPDLDLFGQLRKDDSSVNTSPGSGLSIYKDRGAIDRVDFSGPSSTIIVPLDDNAADKDPTDTVVELAGMNLLEFAIKLNDSGVGINDRTVVGAAVQVRRDGTLLTEGIDYFFQYDTTNDVIHLFPAPGVWLLDHTYVISLDNDPTGDNVGILDLAGNRLQSNQTDGSGATKFTVKLAGLDFGDAPDPSYPSLLLNNGARHIIRGGYLGRRPSVESDSRQTARGDDDEGVVFHSNLIIGSSTLVTATASKAGYLNAWVDMNHDGDWDDTFTWNSVTYSEKVFNAYPLVKGDNALSILIPDVAEITEGTAYVRFRFTDENVSLNYVGEAASGEVEDYAVRVAESLEDMGDAPAKYGTLYVDDGPRHAITGARPYFGTAPDFEFDGQPNGTATGDDENGQVDGSGSVIVDEDLESGIIQETSLVADHQIRFTFFNGGNATGWIQGWIDFNIDGVFDASEQVFTNVEIGAGTILTATAPFNTPTDAVLGQTFARFRISTVQDLGVGGAAPDGEVEDHSVTILPYVEDYGDAPAGYPTLREDDGPRHSLIPGGPVLGTLVDDEVRPFTSALADGDDLNPVGGVDDEDGVTIAPLTPLVPGYASQIIVTGNVGISGSAYLNGWLDFNANGIWEAGEKIIPNMVVTGDSAGYFTQTITVNVPLSAQTGFTFARFRISTQNNLGLTGLANDGEVEDYRFHIFAADYGDAMRGSGTTYNTTRAQGGPAHVVGYDMAADGTPLAGPIYLGDGIDGENNAVANVTATGDDTNGQDDERVDGNTPETPFFAPLFTLNGYTHVMVPGHEAKLNIRASAAAKLDGWIDYNQDGVFGADEHLWGGASQSVDPSTQQVAYMVPESAAWGATYARFRISHEGGLTPDGFWLNGEVEDYTVSISQADYGDHFFQTLLADSGPAHVLVGASNVYLGAMPDAEKNGQPTVAEEAIGDGVDENGGGVTLVPMFAGTQIYMVPGFDATVAVNATVPTGQTALLDAWMDFNANNVFDAGEHLWGGVSQPIVNGANTLPVFRVPDGAAPGKIEARFRVSTVGGLLPTGLAPDGEVEDHIFIVSHADYGDAPDSYKTKHDASGVNDANDGPAHVLGSGYMLGQTVDGENDGQPTPAADGDGADEDGLAYDPVTKRLYRDGTRTLVAPLLAGLQTTIMVNATIPSGTAMLDGWMDFNRNGVFENDNTVGGYSEHLWLGASQTLSVNGDNSVTFLVPEGVAYGDLMARFRLSKSGGLAPTGLVPDGEVEDYLLYVDQADYGDAPDRYPTLRDLAGDPALSGAVHALTSGLWLGGSVDAEANGQPSSLADADDLTGTPDDEDGVVIDTSEPIIPGRTVSVTVTASTAGGILNAWVDFNGDGMWSASERVFANVTDFSAPLTFTVPTDASVNYGETFARFRLSTVADLGPMGVAPDGEVEDYRLWIHQADFGDAADPTYPTKLNPTSYAASGAVHIIDDDPEDSRDGAGLYIGSSVDAERVPQASANADLANGDDNLGTPNDEERGAPSGVYVDPSAPLVPGYTGRIIVPVTVGSAAAKLDVWIDFNDDGDWLDPGEKLSAIDIAAGTTSVTVMVNVPANVPDVKFGDTVARFRLTREGVATPTGLAWNGEVEDHIVTIKEVDYGDAWRSGSPAYATTRGQGGAVHVLDQDGISGPDIFLGGSVDSEYDGQPAASTDGRLVAAHGDNSDEDGVTFERMFPGARYASDVVMIPGYQASVRLVASAAGFLDAWIDFNQDGLWDASEQIFDSKPVVAGLNSGASWAFDVPGTAVFGDTVARFRISTSNADLGPTGRYADGSFPSGEVEDYVVTVTEVDYGDALRAVLPTYPTLRANGGAVHVIAGQLYLGSGVDRENDGQPTLKADGDDLNPAGQPDDEDGVTYDGVNFDEPLIPGLTSRVTVTASLVGVLDVWIDFNGDGDWNDPVEHFRQAVGPGPNTVLIPVPSAPNEVTIGQTYARFRLSDRGVSSPSGLDFNSPEGEVEDYRVEIRAVDYGDAPSPYPTLRSDNGARHLVVPNFHLGAGVDAEVDGQPNAGIGDDLAQIDDEDGIRFLRHVNGALREVETSLRAGEVITIDVAAMIPDGYAGAYLNGWIDWNADGRWDGVNEQVSANMFLVNNAGGADGTQFTVTVPANVSSGVSYARFRLSKDPIPAPTPANPTPQYGTAPAPLLTPEGEVEDYRVFLVAKDAEINGIIFDDLNANGVQDPNEPGLANVVVFLDLNQDGQIDPLTEPYTFTRPDDLGTPSVVETGRYSFTGLYEGGQLVRAINPDTVVWVQTSPYLTTPLVGAPSGILEAIQAVPGAQVSDGQTFTISDGVRTVRFEFDSGDGVAAGSYPVPFAAGDTVDAMAAKMADAITERGQEGGLLLTARNVYDVVVLDTVVSFDAGTTALQPARSHSVAPSAVRDGFYTLIVDPSAQVANVDFGFYRIPRVVIKDKWVEEGHYGLKQVHVELVLTESFGAPVTVNYRTEDRTATVADQDYQQVTNGTVTMPSGPRPTDVWTTTFLTGNSRNDYSYNVWQNHVVFESHDGNDWEIYLGTLNPDGTRTVERLTNNQTDDRFANIYGPYILWSGVPDPAEGYVGKGSDYEIFQYNMITKTKRLVSDNAVDDQDVQLSDTHAVWATKAGPGEDAEIYLIDLASTASPLNISDNFVADMTPQISGKIVVWTGYDSVGGDTDIFLYDVAAPGKLLISSSQTGDDSRPQMDGDYAVWQSQIGNESHIFLYDRSSGLTRQLSTSAASQNEDPQVYGDNVVWEARVSSSNTEIFHRHVNSPLAVNISNHSAGDVDPQIAGNNVVWARAVGGRWEVYHYELGSGQTPQNISGTSGREWRPQVSLLTDGRPMIGWRGHDGTDYEVALSVPTEPSMSTTITLYVQGDLRLEQDEDFLVRLLGATFDTVIPKNEAYIDDDLASVAILNDDGGQYGLDFGDAPDPMYPTLLASDGARHMIDPEVYLGSSIDAEPDGLPGVTAGGDDSSISDDEDGVEFHTPLVPGQTASITVAASVDGVLDAWIDFNGNGVWEEGVERIFAGAALHQFSNSLNINVPADARLGNTYARFRFSRAGIPTVTGTANDGEVEDYRVTITNPETFVSANSATRTITVTGRDYLDDQFQATLGQTLLTILINGQEHEFARADYDTINFDGGDGDDTAEVYASDADNYGEMSYKSGWITDGNVRVNLADSEVLTLHGGAGYDEVKMFDSVFNDVWTAERLSATMDARLAPSDLEPIYLNSADGFERILAVANKAGRDKAILNDSPDVDFVTMQPNDFAWMGLRSELYNEVAPILTYFNRASQFEDIEANSTKGGADVVKFKDWNGADTMHAWPTHATMTNTANTYSFLATSFDYVQSMVYKQRRLGLDTAYLYGMDDASDAFVVNGDTRYTLMKQDDVYAIVAKYFGKVYADTGTGDDTVKILDDPGMGNELLEVKDSDSLGWDNGYRWLRYSNLDSNAVLKFAYEVAKCETATARSSNVMDKSEIDAAVDAWMTVLGTGGWKKP